MYRLYTQPNAPRPEWDRIDDGCPKMSPWGAPHTGHLLAPGIYQVTCSNHGGIYVNAKDNKRIPEPLRAKDGWYEEDMHVSAVYWFIPEAAATKPRVNREKCREELRREWAEQWKASGLD